MVAGWALTLRFQGPRAPIGTRLPYCPVAALHEAPPFVDVRRTSRLALACLRALPPHWTPSPKSPDLSFLFLRNSGANLGFPYLTESSPAVTT